MGKELEEALKLDPKFLNKNISVFQELIGPRTRSAEKKLKSIITALSVSVGFTSIKTYFSRSKVAQHMKMRQYGDFAKACIFKVIADRLGIMCDIYFSNEVEVAFVKVKLNGSEVILDRYAKKLWATLPEQVYDNSILVSEHFVATYVTALDHLTNGEYQPAFDRFAQFKENYSNYPFVYYRIILLFNAAKEFDKAQRVAFDFERLFGKTNILPYVYEKIGSTLRSQAAPIDHKKGKFDPVLLTAAIKFYNKALDRKIGDPQLLYWLYRNLYLVHARRQSVIHDDYLIAAYYGWLAYKVLREHMKKIMGPQERKSVLESIARTCRDGTIKNVDIAKKLGQKDWELFVKLIKRADLWEDYGFDKR